MSNPIVFSHLNEAQRAELVELYRSFEAAGSKYASPEYHALDNYLSENNCIKSVGGCCDWRAISVTEWTKYAIHKEFQIE